VLLPVLTVFFSQAEDGIRGIHVTGVQTCALPISRVVAAGRSAFILAYPLAGVTPYDSPQQRYDMRTLPDTKRALHERFGVVPGKIGRAACRDGGWVEEGGGAGRQEARKQQRLATL